MKSKETPDPRDVEALTQTFSELKWDTRVPKMLLGWTKQERVKFEYGDKTFRLEIENEDGRVTEITLFYHEHIRINREGGESKLEIKGYPVEMIHAVNPENIELDVEPGLVIIMKEAVVGVKKSGRLIGELKESRVEYASGEE